MAWDALVIAGLLNLVAAIAHIFVIVGGAPWYRFFGAGEKMATLAEVGSIKPTIITAFIAIILAVWGLMAFSGAGLVFEVPFLKAGLIGITSIYLLRGILGLIFPFISNHTVLQENSTKFWVVSSAICLLFAAFHLLGLIKHWENL